jgi:hypothetical protein
MTNAIVSRTAEILINDLRDNTNDKLRTATLSIVYELCIARDAFSSDAVLKRIQYSLQGQGNVELRSAALRLKELGVIHRDHNGVVSLTPAFDATFINILADFASQDDANYQPTTTPHVWTKPQQGLKRIASGVRPEMLVRMTSEKMPKVYAALNKMQSVGYVVNKVLAEIPDLHNYLMAENLLTAGKSIVTEYGEYRRMIRDDQAMYFTQTLDWRGRMYYRGILNPSNLGEFGKAAFSFAEQKPVHRAGLEALAIHFANLAGQDKKAYNARTKWAFTKGLKLAAKIAGQKVAFIQHHAKTEKVFMLYVASQEFLRVHTALAAGENVTSGFIVRQDGKCNGIQHGAALSKCLTTAENVSITPATKYDTPTDIYITFRDVLLGHTDEMYHKHIDRDFCKPPVMVRGYGAGKEAIRNDLVKLLVDRNDTSTHGITKALLGDDEGTSELLDQIMDSLDLVIGGMGEVTNSLRNAVKPLGEAAKHVYWVTEDGMLIEQQGQVLDDVCYDTLHLAPKKFLHDELVNKRWVLRNELPAIIDYELSASATLKGIAPNFVHSIDANHIRSVVMNTEASILHTHDDVGTHPEDFFAVNTVIREQFVKLHSEFDWFGSLENYSKVSLPRLRGGYNIQDALQATYLFS